MKKRNVFISISIFLGLLLGGFYFVQKKLDNTVKIGFITDIEYQEKNTQKDKEGVLGKYFLKKAIDYYNENFKPEIVLMGGDYLGKSDGDLNKLKEIVSLTDSLRANTFFMLGNKDSLATTKKEVLDLFELKNSYYRINFKDIKILVLDTTENEKKGEAEGKIEESQFQWLKKQLSEDTPTVIFSHHPLIETPYEDIWRKNLDNQEDVLSLLKESHKKIIAVFSGNTKNDYIAKEGGILFVNISGLTSKNNLGRFSEIEIKKDLENENFFNISLKNHGDNSSSYQFKRDLDIKTSTRIKLENQEINRDNQRWFDVNDKNFPNGVLSKYPSGEPNISLTEKGDPVAAFEDEEFEDKVRIKIYKENHWTDLSDADHLQGIISLGEASNPNIAIKGEDIFVIFTENEYQNRIRLLHWSEENQKWNELTKKGFVSDRPSHEPTLIFDKNKENLYVVFAEEVNSKTGQKQAKMKKWDGQNWKNISIPNAQLVKNPFSSADEFDIAASKIDSSLYLTYEEITPKEERFVRIKKFENGIWNDLRIDKLYLNQISQINGYSPSIAIDSKDNVYLTFVENDQKKIHIYRHNKEHWEDLNLPKGNLSQDVIEPFIEIGPDDQLFLAYSEKKDNVVLPLEGAANSTSPLRDLIKCSPWRVRVQKYQNDKWKDYEDPFNYSGYISKGSGKGDPALKASNNALFIIFSDEENGYASRVKKFKFN